MPRRVAHAWEEVSDGEGGGGGSSGKFMELTATNAVFRLPLAAAGRAVRDGVSEAEWRVLVAMCNGLDEREAAQALGLKIGTVKTQGRMAREKAGSITGVSFKGGSASKRLVLVLVGFLPAPKVDGAPVFPRSRRRRSD